MAKLIRVLAVTSLWLIGSAASAHFEIGKYQGVLDDGGSCHLEIKSVDFANAFPHPLNERVQVQIDFLAREVFQMQHLALVDAVAGTVRPKKEVLTAYKAISGGAEAVELFMAEDAGPVQLIHMVDKYGNPEANQRVVCAQLKYIGK